MYLNKLKNKFNKLLQGNFFGLFQTIFKGEGLEIEDVRPYIWGDDVRYINWKLTAKYNKIFVNVFRQERDIDLHLFLDINNNFVGGDRKKNLDIIVEFLSDLFIFSKKNGINIIGYLPDFKERKIRVYRLGNNLEKMYYFLNNFLEICKNLDDRYISNLKNFFDLQKKIAKRHAIVVIGDFLDMNKDIEKTIKALSEKNDIILFQLPYVGGIGKNFMFLNFIK